MTHLARICAAALIAILPSCSALGAPQKHKPEPKPDPTAEDLFAYIRGALLSLSPDDGINDNVEVTLDPASKVLTIRQPSGHCDEFLSSLDANNLVWDAFDPSDSVQSREKLLRLTVVSVSGKPARTCYDKYNHVDASILANRARLLFSLSRADEVPDFQKKMTKAFKQLIVLSGGVPEKDIF